MATPILRYPYNVLSDKTDYLKINVIEYKAPGLSNPTDRSLALTSSEQSLADNLKKPKATIILPMPQNIGDSNAAGWGEDKMGGFGAAATEAAMGIISGSGIGAAGQQLIDKFQGGISAVTDGTGQQAASAGLAGLAVNALLGQAPSVNSLIGRATGAIINQNVELLFQSVTLRQAFAFTFDLVPRFKREAEEIQKIIRVLKIESAAKKGAQTESGGGFFIKAPNVFQLQYMSGSNPHPFLHKFKTAALIGMSVNYTASGTYATYSDATPVHMQLTLNFQELTPIYAEDYDTEVGRTAVGY
jgi:hypothetical protein